jgi:uncharacterized protein YecE (DUF72 family)
MAQAWIGTSGWVYPGWRRHLYADAPVRRWLELASRTFSALEINGSFYTQIKPATYERWRTETPPAFRFALKGHRFVTHYKRLRDCAASIVLLRDQATGLGDKLDAVLWQLPSNFVANAERLADFIDALAVWPIRHSIEFRHASWFTDETAARLRTANIAVCLSDAPDFPLWNTVTADFVYVRLHGHTRKYASSYSPASLAQWARSTERWLGEGRDVHVYFDNDAEGHAVRNALDLRALVEGTPRVRPATGTWRGETLVRPPPSWGPRTVRASRATPSASARRGGESRASRSARDPRR